MAEYIDREAALMKLMQDGCNAKNLQSISDIPGADVAPVVHGRWEWLGPNRLVTNCMGGTCSACKVRSKYIVNTMLCPNCGAKMDGGDGMLICTCPNELECPAIGSDVVCFPWCEYLEDGGDDVDAVD